MEIEVRIERLRLEMEQAALWARIRNLLPPDSAGGMHREGADPMKPSPMTRVFLVAASAAAVGAAGYGLYRLGVQQGRQAEAGATVADAAGAASAAASEAPPADSAPMSIAQGEEATRRHIASGVKAGDVDPVTGKKVLYYHDPMVPGNKFDKPAKSPFMDMMLVPVYADADGDASKVTVSSRIQQNLGLRTAEVSEGTLAPNIDRGRQHRLQRTRPGDRAGARHRLRRKAASCARRSTGDRRASRWPSCTCPTGSRRRRNSCRCRG